MKHNCCTLFAILSFLLVCGPSDAQTITRFAGYDTSSSGGYGGDGGPAIATAVKMNQPTALAIDAAGNVYIAEGNGNRVRMVNVAGNISTVCGDGTPAFSGVGVPATTAQVNVPRGLTIDPAGNLVIADANNNCIRRIDAASGIITTIAGTGVSGFSGDGGTAAAAKFNIPFDVKYDATGNLYVCDWFNSVVRKISTTNIVTTVAGTGMMAGYSGDGGAATAAKLRLPKRVAFDAAGDLYIVDAGNHSIRKVDMATGLISTVVGSPVGVPGATGDGGPATAALLNSPTAIQFDIAGNMYIADCSNSRIRKVDAITHNITTAVGFGPFASETGDGGPATAATINYPFDLAFDAANNLYIADFHGHTVRRVSPSPSLGMHQYSTQNNQVVLFPNPNNGTFSIQAYLSTSLTEMVSLNVINMLGQEVYSGVSIARNGFVDAQINIGNDPSSGLYLLQLTSGGETTIIRFMVGK